MNILAMTPGEFQTAALTWISVISAIVTAIAVAIPILATKLGAAKEALKQLGNRVDDHSRRISGNSAELTRVALQVVPETKTNQEKTCTNTSSQS